MHDVYAYGVIAPSTLVELIDEFPTMGGYAEIAAAHPSIGGEAAGGAYVLARLGIPTKLAGNRLGRDPASLRTVGLLSDAGVDCSAIDLSAPTSPVTEVVVAGGTARTIFGTYRQLLADRAWTEPAQADVRSSRMVCLDPFFGDASLQVADWCLEAGVPYVTVDVSPDSRIAHGAGAVVVSEEYAAGQLDLTTGSAGIADAHRVLDEYAARCSGLVVLTRGHERLLSARPGEPHREHEPVRVDAVDTTGAGDGFRAGIVYGLLHGFDDDRLIRTASTIAAMICLHAPGVLHSPTEQELTNFTP